MPSEYRMKVEQRKIEKERAGLFNEPVEDDPPARELLPGEADYLCKKLCSKINRKVANFLATRFFEKMIKEKNLVIKAVNGIENFEAVKDKGVIVTCNHVSIADNYVVYKCLRKVMPRRWKLFKVIREGNYTGFSGAFGYFFRNFNTLPLSSNRKTMVDFMKAVSVLLEKRQKILVYPEQEMWRDYRKPRPFKIGAFRLAAKNNAPVLPTFLTMEDTDKLDADGMPIQAFTLWIEKPIFPLADLSDKENAEYLLAENYKTVKNIYEKAYGTPLKFDTETEKVENIDVNAQTNKA